jgi:CMP-N-acetylneuraminic acid synthetase
MRIGIFIPGRLNSERLPNKLLLPIGDTNLWEIACRKLAKLKKKYPCYALCSHPSLKRIAIENGVKVVERDPQTDEVDGPLKYIFKDLEQVKCTHLMFLNPCLLFLETSTILKALEKFESEGMDYATSVKPLQNWLFDKTGMSFTPINYERLTTKEVEPVYQCAHAFHVFNKDRFFENGKMLDLHHGILEVPGDQTIDVDTPLDYKFARWLYENRM